MFSGLSLDQAPPFEAPLKFFLTAPILAIIAGAIMIFFNIPMISHESSTIALLHMITIGYMVMIMFGSLQQMLPVVAGAVIQKAKSVANITFVLLLVGIISFFFGFFIYNSTLIYIASISLLIGVLFFVSVSLHSLLKVKNYTPIIWAITLSLVFFLFALFVGIDLSISQANTNITLSHYDFVNTHLGIAFFGWVFLLICGITFQVVPMFWVTDAFDLKIQKIVIFGIVISVLILLINLFVLSSTLMIIYKLLISSVSFLYCYTTLKKLNNRRRKLKDQSVIYWKISIYFLLSALIYWLLLPIVKMPDEVVGVLFGGFAISLINGMLYKIIPFLVWFHLSAKGIFEIPTMKEMIKDRYITYQRYFHLLFFTLMVSGFISELSSIFKLAGLMLVVSNILLFLNLLSAVKIYWDKR